MENIVVPEEYLDFTKEEKEIILDKLIDVSLQIIDDELRFSPEVNRMDFLVNSLQLVIDFHANIENYEMCMLLKDVVDRIKQI